MANTPDTSNLLLRWSLGTQDTVSLSDFNISQYHDMIWLCKLSIVSFQRWFPEAQFVIGFNGRDFEEFQELMYSSSPEFTQDVGFIDQYSALQSGALQNPYHFWPGGVWWKWIPFRINIDKTEIAIDTDIICISRPQTWYDWLGMDSSIIVAPERFKDIRVNTTGDFHDHPLLRGKPPINCGIVGQKASEDYSERFFEITKEVKFGHTHNSLFITEQGAINLWAYSLEIEGVKNHILDFSKNAWMRDFLFFMEKGVKVETIHAVTWHKQVAKGLKEVLEPRVMGHCDDDREFIESVITVAKKNGFGPYSRQLLSRQLGDADIHSDFLIPKKRF